VYLRRTYQVSKQFHRVVHFVWVVWPVTVPIRWSWTWRLSPPTSDRALALSPFVGLQLGSFSVSSRRIKSWVVSFLLIVEKWCLPSPDRQFASTDWQASLFKCLRQQNSSSRKAIASKFQSRQQTCIFDAALIYQTQSWRLGSAPGWASTPVRCGMKNASLAR